MMTSLARVYFLPDALNLPFGVLRVRDGDFEVQLPANVGLTAFLRVDELVVDCEIVDKPRVLASIHALARATFVAVLIPGILEANLQYTPEVGETGGVVRTQQTGRGIAQLVRVALATPDLVRPGILHGRETYRQLRVAAS